MYKIQKFLKDESAATAIEYGLIAGLISVVIVGGASTIGTTLSDGFNNISSKFPQ